MLGTTEIKEYLKTHSCLPKGSLQEICHLKQVGYLTSLTNQEDPEKVSTLKPILQGNHPLCLPPFCMNETNE